VPLTLACSTGADFTDPVALANPILSFHQQSEEAAGVPAAEKGLIVGVRLGSMGHGYLARGPDVLFEKQRDLVRIGHRLDGQPVGEVLVFRRMNTALGKSGQLG
jgi:hypothetical protein